MIIEKRDECRKHILSLLTHIGRPATFAEIEAVYCVTYPHPGTKKRRELISNFVSQFEKTGLIRADYDSRGNLIQCHAREQQTKSSS
jgi:hypothetical protein